MQQPFALNTPSKFGKTASINNGMQLSELLERAVTGWLKRNKKR